MIFEADWQLLLKWHSAKGFLSKSEAQNTLTPVQGGGRKGRSAINQATQQVVEQELLHLNQKLALDLFLDLWHCFDYSQFSLLFPLATISSSVLFPE